MADSVQLQPMSKRGKNNRRRSPSVDAAVPSESTVQVRSMLERSAGTVRPRSRAVEGSEAVRPPPPPPRRDRPQRRVQADSAKRAEQGVLPERLLPEIRVNAVLRRHWIGEVVEAELVADASISLVVTIFAEKLKLSKVRRDACSAAARLATGLGAEVAEFFGLVRTAEGRLGYAVRRVEGTTLEVLAKTEGLSLSRAVAILRQCGRVLHGGHGVGLLHRSLSLNAVTFRVESSGREGVVISDFGLRELFEGGRLPSQILEPSSAPHLPENALECAPSTREDVYLLGALGYRLLAGEAPFSGQNFGPLAHRYAQEDVAQLASHAQCKAIPKAICAVIERSLARQAGDRQADAGIFVAELEAASRASGLEFRLAPDPAEARKSKPILPAVNLFGSESSGPSSAHTTPKTQSAAKTPMSVGPRSSLARAGVSGEQSKSPGESVDRENPRAGVKRAGAVAIGLILLIAGVMIGRMSDVAEETHTGNRVAAVRIDDGSRAMVRVDRSEEKSLSTATGEVIESEAEESTGPEVGPEERSEVVGVLGEVSSEAESDSIEPAIEPAREDSVAPERDPTRALELAKRGVNERGRGRIQLAKKLFSDALRYDRGNRLALSRLGAIEFDQEQYSRAAHYWRRAVAVSRKDAHLHIELGDAYFRLDRFADARRQYEVAEGLGSPISAGRLRKIP